MVSEEKKIGLLNDLKKGNHESFKKLFEIYGPSLYRFSLSYLKSTDEAEDVVQEVFIKIWENREKIKTDTSFRSYLFTIALNIVRKHFNRLSLLNETKHELLKEIHTGESDIDTNSHYETLLKKMDDLISGMPDKRKAVFIKRKIEGKSLKEISEELNISVKTVEYHITESLKFLKDTLPKFDDLTLLFLSIGQFFKKRLHSH